jgi:hypothetical protein
LKKYSAFLVGQISFIRLRHLIPDEGRIASRHGRGMGCGGRGSVGAIGDRRAGSSCERAAGARTNGVASVLAKASTDGYQARRSLLAKTGRVRQNRVVLVSVAGAKLSVVKSIQPDPIRHQAGSDGDKTNSSPGRARHKP